MAKLRWGLIGGGRGSQIGPAHRISAGLDGAFELCAGALDYRPDEARAFGVELGLTATEPMVAGRKCWPQNRYGMTR